MRKTLHTSESTGSAWWRLNWQRWQKVAELAAMLQISVPRWRIVGFEKQANKIIFLLSNFDFQTFKLDAKTSERKINFRMALRCFKT